MNDRYMDDDDERRGMDVDLVLFRFDIFGRKAKQGRGREGMK